MEDVSGNADDKYVGFKRASGIADSGIKNGKRDSTNDFSYFHKRKVRVNPVDKHVKEYELD